MWSKLKIDFRYLRLNFLIVNISLYEKIFLNLYFFFGRLTLLVSTGIVLWHCGLA